MSFIKQVSNVLRLRLKITVFRQVLSSDGRSLKAFGPETDSASEHFLSLVAGIREYLRVRPSGGTPWWHIGDGIIRFARYTGARPLVTRCTRRQCLYKMRCSKGGQWCCFKAAVTRSRGIRSSISRAAALITRCSGRSMHYGRQSCIQVRRCNSQVESAQAPIRPALWRCWKDRRRRRW